MGRGAALWNLGVYAISPPRRASGLRESYFYTDTITDPLRNLPLLDRVSPDRVVPFRCGGRRWC
jgi:hypothetical protein